MGKKRITNILVAIGIIICVLIVCAESETKHILVLEGVVLGMHISYILDIIIDYRKEKNMDNSN